MVIGIIGGGQLARLMCLEAYHLGIQTLVYSQSAKEPAAKISPYILNQGIYNPLSSVKFSKLDKENLKRFVANCDVITLEFENINIHLAEEINKINPSKLQPASNALAISQDRTKEKEFVVGQGVNVAAYKVYSNIEQLQNDSDHLNYPLRIKTSRFGYDGKGQIRIASKAEFLVNQDLIAKMFNYNGFLQDIVCEEEIKLKYEMSVIIGRKSNGKTFCLTPTKTEHKDGILIKTITPYSFSEKIKKQADQIANKLANGLEIVGILAIEMFVDVDDNIYVNEISARPHNSGHWSLSSNLISQFELLIRSITQLEFPKQEFVEKQTITMINLLGDDILNLKKYHSNPKAVIYNYAKDEIKPGRKMGHVNLIER